MDVMLCSRLQLGTVQFGMDYGIANTVGKPGYAEVCSILRTAYDGGVRMLDTAATYGDSESVLGRALQDLGLAENFTVVTKVPRLALEGLRGRAAERLVLDTLRTSLERLRLPRLPVCLFHHEEDVVHMNLLERARDLGLVEAIGVSLDSDRCLEQVLASAADCVQVPFNILDRRLLHAGFLDRAQRRDIKVFTRSVFLQGLLLMPPDRVPAALRVVLPARARLEALAAAAGMAFSELCLRYVLAYPGVTSVLVGVDSVAQLEENLATTAKGALPEDLFRRAQALVPDFPEQVLRPKLWKK